jgi:hypothetical protein
MVCFLNTQNKRKFFFLFLIYNKGYVSEKKEIDFLINISYMIFKRRDNTNREGNSIINVYITRGP